MRDIAAEPMRARECVAARSYVRRLSSPFSLKSFRTSLLATAAICVVVALPHAASAQSPTGGAVVAGAAGIAQAGAVTTINQSSQKAIINWQGFSVGAQNTVNFNQPNSSAATLNRVIGNEQSIINGAINANGQVFIVNSNGVLFGKGSQVNVGGLVASTLDISNNDFMAGNYKFSGTSNASVVNQGRIRARGDGQGGGYVALLGKTVSNEGVIAARLGTVAMAAGEKITLNFGGDSLLDVTIDKGTLNALVQNKRAIIADGGQVIMTAKAADQVLSAQVNNSGIIQARTMAALKGGSNGGKVRIGKIKLLAQGGTTNVSGKLDASAPKGGHGGFIETSGDHVQIADSAVITTKAASGNSGTWLVDPTDFNIVYGSGAQTTSGIGAKTLQNMLADTNVSFVTSAGGSGNGDINVMAPVTWTSPNSLTLSAFNNINVNANMTWSGGTLTLNAGKNVYVNATLRANSAGNFAANYGHVVNADGTVSAAVTAGLNSDGTPYGLYTYQGARLDTFAGKVDIAGTGTVTLNGQAYTVIKTVDQLPDAAADPSGHYVLGSTISKTLTSAWSSPIGTAATPFSGDFNGLGHYVYLVFQDADYVRQPALAGSGLFGVIGETGVVSNLAIQGTIVGPGSTVSDYVGTLANINHGLIVNDMVTFGDVRNGTLTSGGTTVAAISNLGGLVGQNYGKIIESFYSGSFTDAAGVTGGLVGVNESSGTISQSYTYAGGSSYAVSGADPTLTYIGGFAGINRGRISTSFSNVAIRISDTATNSIAGGFVGLNAGVIDQSYVAAPTTSRVTNTLYSYGPKLAGFVGSNTGTISNSYSTSFTSTDAASKWTAGFAYLNSGNISNSYAISYAAGSATCGGGAPGQCGFVYSNTGTLANTYYTVGGNAVTDGATSGAGVGSAKALNAAEATTFASYGGFSSAIWGASSSGQPILKNLPLWINSGSGAYGDVSTDLAQAASIGGTQIVGFQGGDTNTVTGMFSIIPNDGKYVDAGAYVASQVLTSTVYGDIRGVIGVSPVVLTLGAGTVVDKVYDGTTAATIGTPNLIGLVGSDTIVLNNLAGTYASAPVGAGKAVTLTFTIANGTGKASNYVVSNTATAAITPAPLTISSVAVANKTYDGTTTASVSNAVLGGVFGADIVTLGAVTGAFTDANAGSNKSVILSGLTLSGAAASNYTITGTQTVQTTAAITPLALSVAGAKAPDGSAIIAGSGLAASNVIGGDVVTFGGTATLAGSSAGNQAIISFANLTQSNPNYTLVGASGSVYVGTKSLVLDHVASGTAAIDTSVPNVTTITTSDKAIIDWIRFSVASGEGLSFVQPSATSVTLNRVTGNEASVIAGSLSANGRVFILNSAGVLFGAGSSINVGGLVASTQKMTDADFLAGNYALTATGGVGTITAGGQITIDDGGFLALASQNGVTTTGTITAPNGKVILASAKNLTLTLNTADNGLASYTVSNPSGTTAAGGTIDLAPVAGSGMLETAGASVSTGGLTLNTGNDGTWSISLPSITVGSGFLTENFVEGQLAIRNFSMNALAGDLTVASPVTWSSDHTLTLGASGNIAINASITATGTNAGLVMNYGGDYSILTPASYAGAVLDANGNLVANSAPAGTTYASITLSGSNASLTINGQSYTLVRSLSDFATLNLCANGACNDPVTGQYASLDGYIFNTDYARKYVVDGFYYYNVATNAFDIPYTKTDADGVVSYYNPETGKYDLSSLYNGNISAYYYNPATGKYDLSRYDPATQKFYNPYTGKYDLATAYTGSWMYYNGATGKYDIADYNPSTKQWYDLTTSVYDFSAKNTSLTKLYYNPVNGLYDLWAPYAASGHYAIVNDIDVTGTTYSTSPILSFGGTLTGLGHTIKGLTVTDTTTSSSTSGASTLGLGLIGNAGWGAVVRDIALTNANISGYANTGSLIGYAMGNLTVKNASAAGQVTGTATSIGGLIGGISALGGFTATSSVSYASADVTVVQRAGSPSLQNYVGGLVGQAVSTLISHTSASGDVTALSGPAGGLVGYAANIYAGPAGWVDWSYSAGGTVSNASTDPYTYNAATGGLIGYAANSVTNSFSTENVTGVHGVGGLIGVAGGAIDNTYATGNVTSTGTSTNYTQGGSATGGLVGMLSSGPLTNSWYGNPDGSSVVTATFGNATNIGGLVGYDAFSPIMSNVSVNATVIASATSSGVGGIIGTMAYNSGLTGAVFHGSVTGGTSVGGVVGFVGADSQYGNITVANVEAYGTVNGVSYVGGIVGGGTLSSLSSQVDGVNYSVPITALISNAHSHVDVTGTGDYVGGVIGQGGIVIGSSADGTVRGANYVGGISGYAPYGISDSSFGGSVAGTGPYVGAIAGAAPSGHITNTFFNADTAGTNQSTGSSRYFADSTGLTNDQMADVQYYLNGTINQVLAGRAAAAAQAAAEAAAQAAAAQTVAEKARAEQGARTANAVTSNAWMSSVTPPDPAMSNAGASAAQSAESEAIDNELNAVDDKAKADDDRRKRERERRRTAQTSRHHGHAGGSGGGLGATIRSIDVNGRRFNLENNAPKQGSPAQAPH
jgi:filamentous hemagglutinin family protein